MPRKKTHEQYLKDLKAKGIHLIPLEQYRGGTVPIMHRCTKCGSKRMYYPNTVLLSKKCKVCEGKEVEYGVNSLWDTNPEIASMLADPEIGKKYSVHSGFKTTFICPDCGNRIEDRAISYINRYGLACPKCSDGISYPMKFVMSVFDQLGVHYITEHRFDDWSFIFRDKPYRPIYDIVFGDYVVEVDGNIHYYESTIITDTTLEERQYIDKKKTELVVEHGLNMIRIDCRQSEAEYIKNSILSSELNNLFDLSKIDWNQCHKAAISSRIKEVCDCWNSMEDPTPRKVSDKLDYNVKAVRRWLKKGSDAGMCNYNLYAEGRRNGTIKQEKRTKKVICLNMRKIYSSVAEVARIHKVCSVAVASVCRGHGKTLGYDERIGQRLTWMYYDEYLTYTEEQVQERFKRCVIDNRKPGEIICLTTNKIFSRIADATKEYKLKKGYIRKACNNPENHFYGVHPETKEPLSWMYYSDFLQMNGGDMNCA